MGLSWQQGPLSGASLGAPSPTAPSQAGRRVDRRQRGRAPAPRAWPLPGRVLPGRRRPARRSRQREPDHTAPRFRRYRMVHGDGGRPARRQGRVAIHRSAPLRWRAPRPRRVRLACDGRLLRGGRSHRRPRLRRLPPIDIRQSSRHLVVKDSAKIIADTRAAGRALRVRLRAALVRAAPGHRCVRADPGRGTDVLPVQGACQLLRHRRPPNGPRGRTCGRGPRSRASPTSFPSSRTRSRSSSTTRNSHSSPVSR